MEVLRVGPEKHCTKTMANAYQQYNQSYNQSRVSVANRQSKQHSSVSTLTDQALIAFEIEHERV